MALGVDPSFFLPTSKTAQSVEIVPHFRSLRSTTQIMRDQAQAYGQVVHETVEVFERHVELPERDVPFHAVAGDLPESSFEPQRAAQALRKFWDLGNGPIGHLLRTTELHGVIAVFSPPQSAGVDAYSFDTTSRPITVLNPLKNDYYRQRFDLAHELGHLVMHTDVEPGNRIVEEEAHRFAAELLMPESELRSQLPHRADWPLLQELKEYWGVSLQALLYRARELSVISGVTYRNAMARMSREGWRRQEPGARRDVEQPSLLPHALKVLDEIGIASHLLATETRIPNNLFEVVTSRTPRTHIVHDPPRDYPRTMQLEADDIPTGQVISLF